MKVNLVVRVYYNRKLSITAYGVWCISFFFIDEPFPSDSFKVYSTLVKPRFSSSKSKIGY